MGKALITEDEKQEIIKRLKANESPYEIAKDFRRSPQTIYNIKNQNNIKQPSKLSKLKAPKSATKKVKSIV